MHIRLPGLLDLSADFWPPTLHHHSRHSFFHPSTPGASFFATEDVSPFDRWLNLPTEVRNWASHRTCARSAPNTFRETAFLLAISPYQRRSAIHAELPGHTTAQSCLNWYGLPKRALRGAARPEKALEESNWYVQLNYFTKPLDWPFLDLHPESGNLSFLETARCAGERHTWSTGTWIGLQAARL